MAGTLRTISRYTREFGLVSGMTAAYKVKTGRCFNVSIPTVKHPIALRPDTSDVPTFEQIFLFDEYNLDFRFTPTFIIDGGANIGLATIYFKNRFPDATVVSIEPDSDNFRLLTANTSRYQNVFVKHAGLWPRQVFTRAVDKYNRGKWGIVIEELTDTDNRQRADVTETVTIDSIVTEFQLNTIDLLKLDIETAEKQLFSENYMNWLPRTKMIVIELHDFMLPGCGQTFFNAIHEAFKTYTFLQKGENTIILNDELLNTQLL
ncbi:hypothetical protein GCM10023189_08670 [Nibrella saemangeumensis]|uniref:Methyltransferase FkbM domain-containing protein n=1 Tax=Nibrella saemangeumensis TaxID=1084526 RepID=A0ABP8MIF9_9BACT